MDLPVVVHRGAVTIRISEDPAADVARSLAVRLRRAIAARGSASLAVSGGSTAPPMFAAFAALDLDRTRLTVWQVDERVAPDGDPDRNAGQLASIGADTRLMPVTAADLPRAAERYAAGLPDRFDVVHLGLGDDGHTASWPPAPHVDADVVDRVADVAVIGAFNGRRRMTLTPGPVNHARSRLILTTGADKATVVRRWVDGDPSLPATRVRRTATTLFVDSAASSSLRLGR